MVEVKKEEKSKSSQDKLREVIITVAKTKAGKLLFRHLYRDCGFVDTDSRINPQTHEINPYATVHNAAQRNVYVRLRKLIPKEYLLEIEE